MTWPSIPVEFGDAVERYERGLLLLEYSPIVQPNTELQRSLEAKLEASKQARVTAQKREEDRLAAASKAELEAAERKLAPSSAQRG